MPFFLTAFIAKMRFNAHPPLIQHNTFSVLIGRKSKVLYFLSIIDQHYALIITPLFDTQAPTCFGIDVPSSGSFLCPYELLEGRNGYIVCHVL
jgi:hypothetical protein